MFMDFTPTKDDRFQMVIPHHLALIIFWAYYTVKLLQAELKTENSLKGVCKYIWKNKKWDIYWLLFFIIFTVAYFAGELNK